VSARSLRENSLLALVADAASKVGALAVVIVAARFLSVSEFAVLAAALAAAGVLGALLDLGSGTLLTRDGARGALHRGMLFVALLRARAPFAVAVLALAPPVGLWVGRPVTAIAVAVLAVTGSVALSVLGIYRASQDIRPEAAQKLVAAALSIGAVVLVSLYAPSADVLLFALGVVLAATLAPLLRRAPRIAEFRSGARPASALRLAAPIGLLALATVAYYRAGTLVLAGLADGTETAMFGIAASVAFGLLMVPNAITTALLPRLSAENELRSRVACARRALGVTVLVSVLLAAAAAAVVPLLLPAVLGSRYEGAGPPFAILCAGIPLIATSGVIGTTLLSIGRLRPLGVQVALSLAVNLVVLVALVPVLGAVGAALATVACEAVGLAVLVVVARGELPGLLGPRRPALVGRVDPSGAPAA
jgi:O-antigen/teichoic acid export membrane protein